MSIELAPEIDYKPASLSHGEYKYTRVTPMQQVPATIGTSGGDQIEFELPSSTVFNLSKSVLRFGLAPTAIPSVNTYSNKMYASLLNMRSIELYTRSGLSLCLINDVDFYSNIVWGYDKLEDAQTRSFPTGGTATVALAECCEGGSVLTGAVNAANQTLTLSTTTKNNIARRDVFVGVVNSALSPSIQFEIPLDKIKHSIFDRGVDMIFPENIYMRITTLPCPSITFEATTASNANINTQVAQTVTLFNVEVLLAVQQNLAIKQDLLMGMSKNIEIDIDFAYLVKQSGTTTSQNVSMRISGSQVGSKLKKIYWSCYPAAGTLAGRYDNSIATNTLASFNTFLNSQSIEQILVTPSYAYIMQKDHLDGTVTSDRIGYLNKFTYLQDFCGKSAIESDNFYNDGLPLETSDIKYEIQATTGNTNLNWYMFYVTQRKLRISSTMIELL